MSPWTRRQVLSAAAGAASASLLKGAEAAPKIARRPLGKTGMSVSILGLGGGSQFLKACPTDDAAIELLNAAIDGGINYLDNASSYGDGKSERLYGLILPRRRGEVVVTSKTDARDRDGALRSFERTLKNMRTDHLDLFQIHSIEPDEDLDHILGKDGVFPALLELKAQKAVRAVGITGHASATKMKALVERMDGLDTVLCPVNPQHDARQLGAAKNAADPDGHFRDVLLPAARSRGLGIIAMKTTAQGALIGEGQGKADVATLVRFSMSEPGVAVAIVGPGSLDNLKKNLATAQAFAPLSEPERNRLVAQISGPTAPFAYKDPAYRDA